MITPTNCPSCAHNRLTHKRGICRAIINVNGSQAKGTCGCTAIPAIPGDTQPQQLSLRAEQAWDEALTLATNERILGSRH